MATEIMEVEVVIIIKTKIIKVISGVATIVLMNRATIIKAATINKVLLFHQITTVIRNHTQFNLKEVLQPKYMRDMIWQRSGGEHFKRSLNNSTGWPGQNGWQS